MSEMYSIKNRSAGVAVYRIPELGIRRKFAPGEVKQISAEELEKLTYQPGGMAILANFLQIQNDEAIQKVGLNPQPEYHMSEKDIINLMQSGSLDAFLDCLDFAPPGVIDIIKSLSVSLPLNDMEKRMALKNKTGFDCDAAIKHVMEEKAEDAKPAVKTNERRVKNEEPAVEQPARRVAPTFKFNSAKDTAAE